MNVEFWLDMADKRIINFKCEDDSLNGAWMSLMKFIEGREYGFLPMIRSIRLGRINENNVDFHDYNAKFSDIVEHVWSDKYQKYITAVKNIEPLPRLFSTLS